MVDSFTRQCMAVCLVGFFSLPVSSRTQSVATGTLVDLAMHKRGTLTLDAVDLPLVEVLKRIALRAGLNPIYAAEVTKSPTRVTLHIKDATIADAFDGALRGTDFTARFVIGGVVIVRRENTPRVEQAPGRIRGRVVDARTGQPIRGTMVALDGIEHGTITDGDGRFEFTDVVSGAHTVTTRRLGYARKTTTVTVDEGGIAILDVALEANINALDQIVVTGTVAATALKAVPNAMTVITAKDLEQRGVTHLEQLFRGDVPGMFAVNRGSGSPLDSLRVFSRGVTSLDGVDATTPIKTYVDGVELANAAYLSQIDPRSIERIEILTGPQASTIYGSNAINGVMQIFTKRGTTNRPQLVATLLSGTLQNNLSSAYAPQHDYAAQVSGIEGRWSYNTGGMWGYIGHWTPAIQQTVMGGFGGSRIQIGAWTGDASLRVNVTQNQGRGSVNEATTAKAASGFYTRGLTLGQSPPVVSVLHGQTFGLTLGYTPTSWWSHQVMMGSDASNTEARALSQGYSTTRDTLLSLSQSMNERTSLQYVSTIQVPIMRVAQMTITTGVDGWHNLIGTLSTRALALTGALNGSTIINRQPGHNTGGFVQSQVSVADALFLTYGMRAEWNPNYGAAAQPNYAPRYGLAYTTNWETPWGAFTAKLRGSYGRSTRPPTTGQKAAQVTGAYDAQWYGNFVSILANPVLGPETQQGGEGGVELYLGNRASLVVTRFNQTVEHLIFNVGPIDSVRSLLPYPDYYTSLDANGYGYDYQYQNVNVGSIRNAGWEAQGTVTTGRLTTKGTYSWTKSRVIGIDPTYAALARYSSNASVYAYYFTPGKSFGNFPEHTWALSSTYSHGAAALTLNVMGVGQTNEGWNQLYYDVAAGNIRLAANKATMTGFTFPYIPVKGYAMADANGTYRLTAVAEVLAQAQNIGNYYHNDYYLPDAVLGRQVKIGVRLRY